MKHLEVRHKYSATRCIFNTLPSVSCGDKTLRLMLDILRHSLLAHSPRGGYREKLRARGTPRGSQSRVLFRGLLCFVLELKLNSPRQKRMVN